MTSPSPRSRSGRGASRSRDPSASTADRWEALDLDAAPAPWSHNPSAWSHRIPICLIALAGFLVAGYMAFYQWRLMPVVVDPVFGDQSMQVLDSDVSHAMRGWFGIPDTALGAIAFLGDAIFGIAGSTRRWQFRPWLVIVFGIDVIPLGIVSAVLVGLQGAVVGAWCFPCLVTAGISLVLVAMAFDEVWACVLYLRRVWRRSRSKRVLWDAFVGRPTRAGLAAGRAQETA